MIHIQRSGTTLASIRDPNMEILDELDRQNPGASFVFICYNCGHMFKATTPLETWTVSQLHECADTDKTPPAGTIQPSPDKCIKCDDFVNYCMCNGKKGNSV